MSLGIKVEALAGDRVEATARDMLRLANTLQVRVVCDFNGIELSMRPHGSVDRLVQEYDVAIAVTAASPYKKMAFG